MADTWYYAKGNQQQGPVDEARIRALLGSGELGPGDLVWREGMAQWEPAASVFPGMPAVPVVRTAAPTYAQPQAPQPYAHATAYPADPILGYQTPSAVQRTPCGFWWRVLAYFIDAIVLNIAGCILMIPIGFVLGAVGAVQRGAAAPGTGPGGPPSAPEVLIIVFSYVVSFTLFWLYDALMTWSRHQGTLGKMAIGARVTRPDGSPLTFARSTGRWAGKLLSSITLCVGFIMVAFTDRKRGLHDLIADTVVTRRA